MSYATVCFIFCRILDNGYFQFSILSQQLPYCLYSALFLFYDLQSPPAAEYAFGNKTTYDA